MKSIIGLLLGVAVAQEEAVEECNWWYWSNGMEDPIILYLYDSCALTGSEWYEDPWSVEGHYYFQFYNDLTHACFYSSGEGYATCYPYYRTENPSWEISWGGEYIYNNCGEFDESTLWNCNGGWSGDFYREYSLENDPYEYFSDEYFYECESHDDCSWDDDKSCAVQYKGNDYDTSSWEIGQGCVEWYECDNKYYAGYDWKTFDCYDERFEEEEEEMEYYDSAIKTQLSITIIAVFITMAYAM